MIKNASDILQLSCSFTGTPTPTIVWNRYISDEIETLERDNDKFLIQEDVSLDKRTSTSELTVNDLIKNDEGTYECLGINQVDNLIGAVDSSQAFITIQGNTCILKYKLLNNQRIIKSHSSVPLHICTTEYYKY